MNMKHKIIYLVALVFIFLFSACQISPNEVDTDDISIMTEVQTQEPSVDTEAQTEVSSADTEVQTEVSSTDTEVQTEDNNFMGSALDNPKYKDITGDHFPNVLYFPSYEKVQEIWQAVRAKDVTALKEFHRNSNMELYAFDSDEEALAFYTELTSIISSMKFICPDESWCFDGIDVCPEVNEDQVTFTYYKEGIGMLEIRGFWDSSHDFHMMKQYYPDEVKEIDELIIDGHYMMIYDTVEFASWYPIVGQIKTEQGALQCWLQFDNYFEIIEWEICSFDEIIAKGIEYESMESTD